MKRALVPIGIVLGLAACRQVLGVDDVDVHADLPPTPTTSSAASNGSVASSGAGGSDVSSSSGGTGGSTVASSSASTGGSGGALGCVLCSGKCVDYESDDQNCGACGAACTGGEACVTGVCGHHLESMPSVYYGCAAKSDGSVWCWGQNVHGELGTGTYGAMSNPTKSIFPKALYAASTSSTTCALTLSGEVYCAGWNLHGEIGDGTIGGDGSDNVLMPSMTLLPKKAVEIAGNGFWQSGWHTCARLEDGTVWCWGNDQYGQLGTGGYAASVPNPVQANVPAAVQVSAGIRYSCGLLANGDVWCWGQVDSNGVPVMSTTKTPFAVPQATGAVRIATGGNHICLLRADASVLCWGTNSSGQIGNGTVSPIAPMHQVNLPVVPVQIATGSTHTCARSAAGEVYCWGESSAGQLGDGTVVDPQMLQPKPTPQKALVDDVVEIACTIDSTIARRADGSVWQWGCSYGDPAGAACTSIPAPRPSFP